MNEQLEAINEAILFIQHNWIDKSGTWRGEATDLVGAVIKSPVTKSDIKNLIQAINDGEPIMVEGIGGTISDGKLIDVWVSKCTD
tara:strand:- start:1272 stop:1526 length:255 start_codon:yes stop_codon:yes gene_type:complete